MKKIFVIVAFLFSATYIQADNSEKIKGNLYSRKFSAHTRYVIDAQRGNIDIKTSARAFFMPIKDNRSFNLEPELLYSDSLLTMEPGTRYSLDIKSDSPRYFATLKSVDAEKQRATLQVDDMKAVISLYLTLDLSKEIVDLKKARITLLRVGGVTLDVKK